jgi:C1q domain
LEKVVDSANAVQFHVKTKRSLRETGEVSFDVIKQDIGHALNKRNGVFTAPVAGIYFFNLTASWGELGGYVYLRKNSVNFGPWQNAADILKTLILKLDAGDKITVYVQVTSGQGSYRRSEPSGFSFELFGVLLYEINQETEPIETIPYRAYDQFIQGSGDYFNNGNFG